MYKTSLIGLIMALCGARVDAQESPTPPTQDPTHKNDSASAAPSRWMVMNDGVLFANFNAQGSPRGQTEFKSQNWFMTMAQHRLGPGQLTLKGMFTAEPLTVTTRGYSQIFQTGEAYNQLENVDYQHPHNMFIQLAAVWRVPLGGSAGLAFSGGPVGEATIGPAAFMHRQSASENPTAPLSHHVFDSTHIVEGVMATSFDRGPWVVEASAFHGRESNQRRYNLETGALDSWAARLLYKSPSWLAQVSHGFLKQPEELEPGDQRRTTASISWTKGRGQDYLAVTTAVGHNRRYFDTNTTAFLTEATLRRGRSSFYTRIEVLQVTSEHLLFPTVVHRPHPGELIDVLGAFTGGGVRDVGRAGPLDIGIGADATFYRVPDRLATSTQVTLYGAHPTSFHVFLRVRPRAPAMGHMWNMMMPNPAMR